ALPHAPVLSVVFFPASLTPPLYTLSLHDALPISLKRLSVSEAVMELDLTGASCLVFQHGGSGRLNIIYRRTDGNVGWVDPPAVRSEERRVGRESRSGWSP